MNKCYYCFEKIQDEARKCRHCGEHLGPHPESRQKSAKASPSYLSPGTRRVRRALFGVSLISFAVWYTGKWPQEVTALGLQFDQTGIEALKLLLLAVSAYLEIYFLASVGSDWIAFGYHRKQFLDGQRWDRMPNRPRGIKNVLRLAWRRPAVYGQIILEVWLPGLVGLCSLLAAYCARIPLRL